MLLVKSRLLRDFLPKAGRNRLSLSAAAEEVDNHKCWSCGNDNRPLDGKAVDIVSVLFCRNNDCGKIQPLQKDVDYFDLLGVPGGKKKYLSADTSHASLDKAYKGLQKQLHPDLFSRKSLMEQELSATNSALVNAAFQCLRNDIDRAGYILFKYHDIEVLSESGGSHHDAELNMMIFELREEIDELDYSDKVAVEGMVTALTKTREEINHALHAAIETEDVELMTKEAVKLRYWVKMIEEVEERRGD